MKTAIVAISGLPPGENIREVEIAPGTMVRDCLKALGLDQHVLSREGEAMAFAAEEDLYAQIDDGCKLRCTPIAEVGSV